MLCSTTSIITVSKDKISPTEVKTVVRDVPLAPPVVVVAALGVPPWFRADTFHPLSSMTSYFASIVPLSNWILSLM